MSMEDLIPEEDVVVTITRGGYAKRTRVDQYRLQGRGGKGVRGASLRGEDLVEHFFATTSHHWLLFFTNLDYAAAPYLVLATKAGVVKKTRLTEYDSPRSGGLIAVNLRDGDELVGVDLVSAADDLLLISRKGMSVRFHATDAQLRPMGRSTTGVTGMKFKSADDELLSMSVIREGEDPDVFVVFENGMAKRTASSEWDAKGRATLGVKVANLTDKNGDLVGGLTVDENDQVLVVFAKGNVVRMAVQPVTRRGRNTQGMGFAKPGKGDSVVAGARNVERSAEDDLEDVSTVTSDTESPPPGTDDDGGKA